MTSDNPSGAAVNALGQVTAALPASEERPGQREMAQQVSDAIESGRHLVVQASEFAPALAPHRVAANAPNVVKIACYSTTSAHWRKPLTFAITRTGWASRPS